MLLEVAISMTGFLKYPKMIGFSPCYKKIFSESEKYKNWDLFLFIHRKNQTICKLRILFI